MTTTTSDVATTTNNTLHPPNDHSLVRPDAATVVNLDDWRTLLDDVEGEEKILETTTQLSTKEKEEGDPILAPLHSASVDNEEEDKDKGSHQNKESVTEDKEE